MIRIKKYGNKAILLEWEQVISTTILEEICWVQSEMKKEFSALVDCIPGFASLTLVFDLELEEMDFIYLKIETKLKEIQGGFEVEIKNIPSQNKIIKVPICFDVAFALDLDALSNEKQIDRRIIIARYLAATYQVHLMGFLPGFVYLGGLDKSLVTKRKTMPRQKVPKGSVAIGGQQTGIYPSESPGGWQVIGRTPIELFGFDFAQPPDFDFAQPTEKEKPSPFEIGDQVHFYEIDKEEFNRITKLDRKGKSKKVIAIQSENKKQAKIKIIRAGVQSSIQDIGRVGYRHLGLPVAGPMDKKSASLANLLLGNSTEAPLLEMTLLGPTLEFSDQTTLVLTGATVQAKIKGQVLPMNQLTVIQAGERLEIGRISEGCRAYLGIKHGFLSPKVLGSTSYCSTAALGIAPLQKGATLSYIKQAFSSPPTARIVVGALELDQPIRLLPGPEFHLLLEDAKHSGSTAANKLSKFFATTYSIAAHSNRMAYCLEGAPIVLPPYSMLSSAVLPGTLQLPPSGLPIILMRDCQTVGGYPRIFQVLEEDLDRVGQLGAKMELRFVFVEKSIVDAGRPRTNIGC